MYVDMKKLTLISMSKIWTEEERKRYVLFKPKTALEYNQTLTNKNFGYSVLKWAFYYLLTELNPVGFDVIVGNFTGKNKTWLENFILSETDLEI